MRDPIEYVLAVFAGWVMVGLLLSAGAAPLARRWTPRVLWGTWAAVVLPVYGAGAWFILANPLSIPLGPAYHLLLLALLVLTPSAGAVWTAAVRARRDPVGPILVDVLLTTFTFVAVLVVGFLAGIIPDLMTVIGV